MGKSWGMAATRSNLAFDKPAFTRPFLHIRAKVIGCICFEFVIVHSKPLVLTKGAARETNSS